MAKTIFPETLIAQLHQQGYSEVEVKELWKWYDDSEKKGVASY
jgi:hypothetical protein